MFISRILVPAAIAVSLAAQTAQTPIRFGQTVTGRLIPGDQQFGDGSRYKMFVFAGGQGDTITAEMTSTDFDANLVLADASGNSLSKNDDGGGTCNARLSFVLPRAANYRLYANSSATAELGYFRLTLSRGRTATAADTSCRGFGRVAGLIQVGQTVTGTLSSDDPEIPGDSTYFQRWILPVKSGQAFTVDLESTEFDAYLLLTRGRDEQLVENDDGGTGCNARLVYTATDDRPLRVMVNTASRPRRQTGRFTLRVSEGESATEPKGNCRPRGAATASPSTSSGGTITVGQSQQGSLTRNDVLLDADSTYAQMWTIQGRVGQTITVDLESDEFDAYLMFRGPGITGGRDYQDDDSGGNCNARLTATLPQSGAYEIVVNTADKRATGRFSLSVTSGSKPKSLARCSRSR